MINIAIAEDDFRIAQIHEKFIEHLDGFNVIGKAINAKDTISRLRNGGLISCFWIFICLMSWGQICFPLSAAVFLPLISSLLRLLPKQDSLQEALRSGVSHYVIKPVSAHKFTEVLLQYREKENGCTHSRS